jgi:release factor glutamine methyltransferase
MDLRTALRQGTQILEDAAIPAPRLTAEVLLCHALQRERSYLFAHPEEELGRIAWIHYGRYLHERLSGKPTQYILKKQEFFGREFIVTPDVLIPRPETEHVVETALDLAPDATRILDVGCGSGAIAVTLSLELKRRVSAVDVSLPALAVARQNAQRLGADVDFFAGDVTTAVRDASLDLLVSNPPYVPIEDSPGLQREVREYEPHVALFAGPAGLDVYGKLTADAGRVLRPGGWLIMELGFKTCDAVQAMLGPEWQDVRTIPDLAGILRVLAARWGI